MKNIKSNNEHNNNKNNYMIAYNKKLTINDINCLNVNEYESI